MDADTLRLNWGQVAKTLAELWQKPQEDVFHDYRKAIDLSAVHALAHAGVPIRWTIQARGDVMVIPAK